MFQNAIFTTVLKLKCTERLHFSPVTISSPAVDAVNR